MEGKGLFESRQFMSDQIETFSKMINAASTEQEIINNMVWQHGWALRLLALNMYDIYKRFVGVEEDVTTALATIDALSKTVDGAQDNPLSTDQLVAMKGELDSLKGEVEALRGKVKTGGISESFQSILQGLGTGIGATATAFGVNSAFGN
jgi:hypothetical protein